MPHQKNHRPNKRESSNTAESIPEKITDGRYHYQIGTEIGRGGFAVVYQAFNAELGEFYAVKRFPLNSIDAESLGQIEAEIELMKKLNHPNIVKYVDTIRTESFLYIVLEFMENGSLQSIIKKFGSFSESLAAIYVVQVLRGLKYLHEQGVLHRDIKGANILTSKDGQVKLADFGVAMKLSDVPADDEQYVVGTPYWMAPEIIEMSTPTPACDIWSVGCLIIELLTGKPPYFDLAPMAALFRIVQDDFPPLPEGISQALRDFLLLCFQKEPAMRKTADKLLEHPWLQNQSNNTNNPADFLPSSVGQSGNDQDTQVIVATIKMFQKDMKKNLAQTGGVSEMTRKGSNSDTSAASSHAHPDHRISSGEWDVDEGEDTRDRSSLDPGVVQVESEGESDEDWDAMGEEPTRALAKNSFPVHATDPTRPNTTGSNIKDFASMLRSDKAGIAGWEEELDAADIQSADDSKRRKHARSSTHVSVAALVPNISKYQETDDDNMDDFGLDDTIMEATQTEIVTIEKKGRNSINRRGQQSQPSNSMTAILQQRLKQTTVEAEADAFEDFQFEEHDFQHNETRDVDIRRSKDIRQLMASIKPDSSEKDVIDKCNQLLVTFDKYPEQREHLITQHGVLPVLDMLEARSGLRSNIPVLDMLEARSGTVRPHVLRVINKIVEGSTRAQEQLSLVGLIPIVMRLLEYTPNPKGRPGAALSDVVGVDPVVLEAARFVHQISSTSSLTLQMLIGAGGLPVLVHMVAFSAQMSHGPEHSNTLSSSHSDDARKMVYMGLDCIMQVFSVQSTRTRDFCRLFVKLGILPHLSAAFKYVMGIRNGTKGHRHSASDGAVPTPPAVHGGSSLDADELALRIAEEGDQKEKSKYANKIANIFWIFSRYEIAEHMARDGVLEVIMTALQDAELTDPVDKFRHLYDRVGGKLSAEHVETMELLLKCIKNLSMEPTGLIDLENIGAIRTLIPLLDGPIRERCKNHVLPCMYNLCRINKRRQETAAVEGLIPHLQRFINEGSHLKQFALPIICDLAHTSSVARAELWNNNGVVFYINLLTEKYWQTFALNSLAVWLANDRQRVESLLIEPANVAKLVDFFRLASVQTINTVHKPLLDMMSKSRVLSRALGSSGLFVLAIVTRLNSSEAIVLRSLLRMLQYIHQHHSSPRQLVLDHNLYSIVRRFAQEEGQVLVNQMANRLLRDFQASTLS